MVAGALMDTGVTRISSTTAAQLSQAIFTSCCGPPDRSQRHFEEKKNAVKSC